MEQQVFLDTCYIKLTKHYSKTNHIHEELVQKKQESQAMPRTLRSALQSCPVKKLSHCPNQIDPRDFYQITHTGSPDPGSLNWTRLALCSLHLGEQQNLSSSGNSDTISQAFCNTGLHLFVMDSSYECSICFQVTPGP